MAISLPGAFYEWVFMWLFKRMKPRPRIVVAPPKRGAIVDGGYGRGRRIKVFKLDVSCPYAVEPIHNVVVRVVDTGRTSGAGTVQLPFAGPSGWERTPKIYTKTLAVGATPEQVYFVSEINDKKTRKVRIALGSDDPFRYPSNQVGTYAVKLEASGDEALTCAYDYQITVGKKGHVSIR